MPGEILEVKETLAGERREFVCALLSMSADEAVVLYELPRDGQVADVALPRGTRSLGYFWTARPYNAYHWLAPNGRTLGLYLSISDRTSLTPEAIRYRDLAVDLLVTPDGRCRVLDEDELPADLDPALQGMIAATRDSLLRQPMMLLADIEQRSARLLAAAAPEG